MRLGTDAGAITGVALLAWLVHSYGVALVLAPLRRAGWGVVPVTLSYLVRPIFSSAAWLARYCATTNSASSCDP